jgi:hypothetical protein
MSTESTAWRKFLQPVVTGLVALMAAGVGYLQYLQRGESEKRDSRISVLEVQMSELGYRNIYAHALLERIV